MYNVKSCKIKSTEFYMLKYNLSEQHVNSIIDLYYKTMNYKEVIYKYIFKDEKMYYELWKSSIKYDTNIKFTNRM